MLRSRETTGFWRVFLAVGMCALMTSGALADPIGSATYTKYSTSGAIGLTGITGPNIISFVPESAGVFTSPSAFSLGTFVVGALPGGVITTYDHTPFAITYTSLLVNGALPSPNDTPISITGFLNGKITGPSQSDVVATFNPISAPSFQTGDFLNVLSVLDPQVSLVPSTTNAGRTTAQGYIITNAAPIPEPASMAIFLTALGGLGLSRLRRAR